VRTTIHLPDDLLVEANERAARTGRSLSDVIADAVRSSFAWAAAEERGPVKLPTFAGGRVHPAVDLDDTAALLELTERVD